MTSTAYPTQPEEGTLQWLLQSEASSNATNPVYDDLTEPAYDDEKTQDQALLSSSDYLGWMESAESSCLLITAPPGSEKSVFSNFTIKHLQSRPEASTKVIYYFTNIHVPISERSTEVVIRALLVQLCKDQRDLMGLLPSRFQQDWKEFFKASSTELLGTMKEMLEKSPFPL
jgi:hypothetical protein